MVEAEEVQDGGLEVVDVDFVLYDRETEFIGLAVTAATLDAAAREENREGVGEMIASQHTAGGGATFAEGRAAKFTAPDDQRVFEQATLPKVADERGHGLVCGTHFSAEPVADVLAVVGAVEVPAPIKELHETHPLLEQTAGQQAVVGKAGVARLGAVIGENVLRFAGNVHDLRDAGLHPESQFVLRDARCRFGVAEFALLFLVEVPQGVECLAS